MSASTEIPDIITGITDAIGINRLWQTEQQLDSEKRRSEQANAEANEEGGPTNRDNDNAGDVAPVSIVKQGERKQRQADADHDVEIHGVPRLRTPPDPSAHKGYEWSVPSSLSDIQAKRRHDSEPARDNTQPWGDEPETDGGTSKSSFVGSLLPFLNQERQSSSTFPLPAGPQSTPLGELNFSEGLRRHSSPSHQRIDHRKPRPKPRRQSTMPLQRESDTPETSRDHPTPRSRWISATQALRFHTRRKKQDKTLAKTRGAELITTLAAGAPAVNIFASHMVLDERSHQRIPVIVDLLKIDIVDSEQMGRGHIWYHINLTYGEGPTQMKWTIQREHRDFQNLHNRLRLLYLRKRDKLPEFPHSTFPFWLGSLGGLKDDDKKDIKEGIPQQLGPGIAAGVGAMAGAIGGGVPGMKKKDVQMLARIKLQEYLMQLAYFLRSRLGFNRLCKFLELSTLGIRLASEGSYHGKEGWLVIASAKGSNSAIHCNPRLYKRRHTPKWFMVRHSYIVCVEELEGMNIYDVLLVDSDFKVEWSTVPGLRKATENSNETVKHHFFTVNNAERTFKLGSESDKKMMQFIQSIESMKKTTVWSRKHRFDSFAPVRQNVQCQWLVDGRDYFWNVSRAILNARDVIYIHDWWLSPELHMRRPAAYGQKWRLDRLLQRKAEEGVKIYVIIYQNVGTTVPIDSTHTKYRLLDLHKNVFVQRSPRHVGGLGSQNVFFWAHHEKVISIDHTIGFVGGLDLCFGRWDSPEHVLADDKPRGLEEDVDYERIKDHQVWPGKDYSNPRIHDFFELDKPDEDMYDRKQTPRMPWHDVSMQVTGQPARDIARHFVQRWNYLLRTKPPTKVTPILLPPPDFTAAELESLNLNGTCEVQLLRSCGQWSMGLQDKTEQSIQNAYLKCIEQSEHFVYIENQFFITSCECDGTKIENQIGNAIVNRIIRAHKEGTEWRAIILMPLMPGFQNTIDSPDGSSLRLIMYAQYYSLCRGESSIFGRLRRAGIEPEDYISVYGLRGWGKIGEKDQLVTEQVYIHAKIMIVDDRVAIIGSANINERSMRGNRDSEVAAIVRDTKQYEITMAGKPFMVGKFAHTLRMRLQLEHLGVNTDDFERRTMIMDGLARVPTKAITSRAQENSTPTATRIYSFNHDNSQLDEENYHINDNISSHDEDEEETDGRKAWYLGNSRSKHTRRTSSEIAAARKIGRPSVTTSASPLAGAIPINMGTGMDYAEEFELGKRNPDVNNGKSFSTGANSDEMLSNELSGLPTSQLSSSKPRVHHGDGGSTLPVPPKISRVTDHPIPVVDPFNIVDPLEESYFWDQWDAVARHNTAVYRRVFRPMPDNEVKTWSDYKEFFAFEERLAKAQGLERGKMGTQLEQGGASGPVGALGVSKLLRAGKTEAASRDNIKERSDGDDIVPGEKEHVKQDLKVAKGERVHEKSGSKDEMMHEVKDEAKHVEHEMKDGTEETTNSLEHRQSKETNRKKRSKSNATRAGHISILPRDTMEELLSEVQGHLVEWPMDWLAKEDANGNFLYNIDKVQPMEIYN